MSNNCSLKSPKLYNSCNHNSKNRADDRNYREMLLSFTCLCETLLLNSVLSWLTASFFPASSCPASLSFFHWPCEWQHMCWGSWEARCWNSSPLYPTTVRHTPAMDRVEQWETVGRGGKEQETLTGSYCRRQREGEGLKVGFPDPLKEVHWALSRQRLWVQMRMEGWMWMVYVLAALFHQVGHPQTFTLSKLLF